MTTGADRSLQRWRVPVALAALCALGLVLRLWVNVDRTLPGWGDVSFYYTQARNVATGRGFVLDYIPDYLGGADGIPVVSTQYWMPFASLWCVPWMKLFGDGYTVAQTATIALGALTPIPTYLIGRDLLGSKRVGLAAAALASALALFLFSPCAPQTHVHALVFGSLLIWALYRAADGARFQVLAGLLVAILHMNRSDGILLAPVVLVALRCGKGEAAVPWSAVVRRAGCIGAVYLVAMLPLALHNLRTIGAPLPSGLGRLAIVTQYAQLYSLPESVTWQGFLESGPAAILEQRWKAFANSVATIGAGLAVGSQALDHPMRQPAIVALVALAWLGLPVLVRRRFLGMWTWVAALTVLYSIVFAESGIASIRAAAYAFHPVMLCAAAAALFWLADFVARGRASRSAALAALVVLAIGIGNVGYARAEVKSGVHWLRKMAGFQRQLVNRVIEPNGLEDATFFARGVHQLHANTGLRLASFPYEPEPTIRALAKRIGVTHVLFVGRPAPDIAWTAPYEITVSDAYERIWAGELSGQRAAVYRIR